MSPVVHTSNISTCQKKKSSFPVAVNNCIEVGPLVFLLQMFVINMLTSVWQQLEYRIDVCRVTRGAHIEQI